MQWVVKGTDSIFPFSPSILMDWFSARFNSVMFSFLWVLSPILVAVVGFFVFVIQGNELSVSIAFTVCILLLSVEPVG